ncbi:EAL domain-containing protein [Methylonatrum kenyense]|uniref:EAL domain-containing response regulator n=1 Tax=Methylonatrum kenyense TaxID=455253 RepID=UPI0020BD571F|nr:EAL domain-containing protein [Methylonatrum kenyense]MCK8517201.1 EAL domain-containing protein [Methylonatrum kenyense]
MADDAAARPLQGEIGGSPDRSTQDLAAVRILLADDDPAHLESMRTLLSTQGFPVDCATGGQSAIEHLARNAYDLLLLDLRMPDVDGLDVLRFIRDRKLQVLTVVVSGQNSADDVTDALHHGADDYLKKPYRPEELLARVGNALQRKSLADSNHLMRRRLERSERLHRLIVNNSPDIVFVLDPSGRFRFLNPRIGDLLGHDRRALLGQPFLDIVHPDEHEKASYFLEQAISPHSEVRSAELQLQSADAGRALHFEVAVWPTPPAGHEDGTDGDQSLVYGTARDVTERKESEAFINFQAYHDLLTRLPNRALFKDRVEVAIAHANRNDSHIGVLFIDLDRFKVINDSLGHTMGDRLLQLVAERLQGCIRKGDTLSRFGGDEFTLLLTELQDESAAVQVANKIQDSLEAPFKVAEHELIVGASIGIAVYPRGGDTLDALIRNADIAMYREKVVSRNGVRVFAPDMGPTPQRLELEQGLRRALENNEFQLLYQPQVEGISQRIVGVEALVRWQHPERGLIPPADFIPLAEETRLIVQLDRASLRLATTEMQALHEQGSRLRLGVNLSPILVEREDFVDSVLEIVHETGFSHDMLDLEITESLLMSDNDETVRKLKALTRRGIRIAIDDFGTGYSCMAYLQKLPVQTLKIDRSFTHAIGNGSGTDSEETSIVNAIVAIGHGLRMNLVAEGVETPPQREYLGRAGCQLMQGYLFGHPRPLDRLCQHDRPSR